MPLVTRNHPKLTLEGARAVLAASEQRAVEINCPMSIAIMDEGGHLLLFSRMDGAKLSSIEIAMVKARAAAVHRSPTGPAKTGDQPNVVLALGLAMASPKYQIPIRGGVPLIVDGQPVGSIGVSAGTEDQDLDVARAGAVVLEKA